MASTMQAVQLLWPLQGASGATCLRSVSLQRGCHLRRRWAPAAAPPAGRVWWPAARHRGLAASSATPSPGGDTRQPPEDETRRQFAPSDGRQAYAGLSTGSLVFSLALLQLCQWRLLVEWGSRIVTWAASPGSGALGIPLLWATRWTAFPFFCGGETLEECLAETQRLTRLRVRCIVDWSVEEDEDAEAWERNAVAKARVLERATEVLGASMAFMPIKLTAMVSPALLERLTTVLAESGVEVAEERLCVEDRVLLSEALECLSRLCATAQECGVPLLLDAEQSARQPAVHFVARELQRRFNVDGEVVVYDTFQMYLQDASARLEEAAEFAEAGGYTLAVKLVRGAYIQQEGEKGTVHKSKEQTDEAFDKAAARLLAAIARGEGSGAKSSGRGTTASVALVLATHNRASLEQAVVEMARLGLSRSCPRVHFAQILGMVDNLTFALSSAGYNATKLVVFGSLRDVLPWLLRRVQENKDAFGAQARELPVLRGEIWRRLSSRS